MYGMEYRTNVGDLAPDFTLKNTSGKSVRLYDSKNRNKVLLFFFDDERAKCLDILSKISDNIKKFKSIGAEIFPVTGKRCDEAGTLAKKLGLKFDILCDEDHGVIKMYKVGQCSTTAAHVCFEVITNVTEPTILIIDTSGVIRFKQRIKAGDIPETDTLLAHCERA
jgi:peroxiredoxin Q/BCP